MKDEMKKYEKPSIEVMDIQWGECIAQSLYHGNMDIKVFPTPVNDTYLWFSPHSTGQGNSGTWDNQKF